jgi:hypothetical protein
MGAQQRSATWKLRAVRERAEGEREGSGWGRGWRQPTGYRERESGVPEKKTAREERLEG